MEGAVRAAIFLAVFAVMALAEWRRPCRALSEPRARRWARNLGLLAIDVLVLRFTLGAAAFLAALKAEAAGWGLFNLLGLPLWAELPLALALLDLAIYGQHVASHRLSLLWRLHRVHHLDLNVDLTTGLRFHPFEILLSMAYKAAVVLLFGFDAWAVLLYEALLNGAALFNHANLRLPPGLERALRAVVVTPDMHRVHHSTERAETDSNYGNLLSLWDRLFGSYRPEPRLGHAAMAIGLAEERDARRLGLLRLLGEPFRPPARRRLGERPPAAESL